MLLVLSKHSLSDDICERRLLIDSGMFLRMEGGWLDCLCTYNGTIPVGRNIMWYCCLEIAVSLVS